MEWIETPDSASLLRFAYEETSQILTVEFKNGTTYQYFDIPESCFEEFKAAPSKGKFLASVIKGKYRFARA